MVKNIHTANTNA